MKYFFILGKNPTLSIAEISAVFADAQNGEIAGKEVFIFETEKKIDAGLAIKKMGGIIKIGVIESAAEENGVALLKIMQEMARPSEKKKFNFGISNYSGCKIALKILGMEMKKCLRQQGVSCRWVTSREPTLSSVVVEQNKLTTNGIEFVLIKFLHTPLIEEGAGGTPLINGFGRILIGRTLAVQPFKELSWRDYGRPARDEYSGMLPPKLAQIMINMAIAPSSRQFGGQAWQKRGWSEATILDPFCGSGTILTEAMLMGYKNLVGGDISKKAIEDTRKNIEWTKEKFQIPNFKFQIFNTSAVNLSSVIKPNSIDAIVTEPYLGPSRGKMDIAKTKKELEALYSKSLSEFKKILKPGGRIVTVWPAFILPFAGTAAGKSIFRASHDAYRLSPNLSGLKIINPIPEKLRGNKIIELTPRNTIIYGREGQRVWREIVILER